MTTPILSKLIAAGLSAALGGAGLFTVAPEAPVSPPSAPTMTSVAFATPSEATDPEATDPGMASLLSRVDPSVLSDPEVAAALRDPRVVSVLSDAEVQRALEDVDPAVLTRPAVLEAIALRQVTPEALADPVVQANLPAILSALPTLRAAYERADSTPGALAETDTPELVVLPEAAAAPIPTELPVEALPVLIAAGAELADAPELEALPPTVVPSLVATAAELAPALEGGEVDAEAVVTAALPAVLDIANALLAAERSPREAAQERREARTQSREARVPPRSDRASDVLSELLGLGLRVAVNPGR
ncbi:MAG: hypothetical protein AB8I08_20900 [Sandaracinaceae bacterium]